MTERRSPAVSRWLRRPLWWMLAVSLLGVVFSSEGIATYWTERSIRAGAVPAEGEVLGSWDGGDRAPVLVLPPGGGDRVATTVWVGPDGRVAVGSISLEVDPDDAERARLPGPVDSWPLIESLTFFGPLLLALVLWWGLRFRRQGRSERLAADAAPAFRMVAVPAPGRFARRRWTLHLYPLDALPGAAPVCSVPVIGTETDLRPRVVDVKGQPRPGGEVVAMEPDSGWVWWPSSRAVFAGRQTLPEGSDWPVSPRPSNWRWALVVVGAVLMLAGLESGEPAEDLNARSKPVTVTVVDGHDLEVADTDVRYRWDDQAIVSSVRLVGPQSPGDQHVLRIDPEHPSRLWQPGTEESLPGQDTDWSGWAMTVGTVLLIVGILGVGQPEGRADERQPLR